MTSRSRVILIGLGLVFSLIGCSSALESEGTEHAGSGGEAGSDADTAGGNGGASAKTSARAGGAKASGGSSAGGSSAGASNMATGTITLGQTPSLSVGAVKMIVDPLLGGRIVSFTLEGQEVLLPESSVAGSDNANNFGVTFWPSPQFHVAVAAD
ncbi:MAG: hypothetical protein QM784_19815 [Polyangiaceae bacterium]